jgi:predicted  nucleic acid-binding Zn ribbon protein
MQNVFPAHTWERDEAQFHVLRASAYFASYMAGCTPSGRGEVVTDEPLPQLQSAIHHLSEALRSKPEWTECSQLLSLMCAMYLRQAEGDRSSLKWRARETEWRLSEERVNSP